MRAFAGGELTGRRATHSIVGEMVTLNLSVMTLNLNMIQTVW